MGDSVLYPVFLLKSIQPCTDSKEKRKKEEGKKGQLSLSTSVNQ